jgi:hypothetical protein
MKNPSEEINMAETVSCRDVGMDCDFVAKGETNEDILQRTAARLFPSTPSGPPSFRGTSSPTRYVFRGRLLLDVETSLEVRAFINGDAMGRDVAHDNGRLL